MSMRVLSTCPVPLSPVLKYLIRVLLFELYVAATYFRSVNNNFSKHYASTCRTQNDTVREMFELTQCRRESWLKDMSLNTPFIIYSLCVTQFCNAKTSGIVVTSSSDTWALCYSLLENLFGKCFFLYFLNLHRKIMRTFRMFIWVFLAYLALW